MKEIKILLCAVLVFVAFQTVYSQDDKRYTLDVGRLRLSQFLNEGKPKIGMNYIAISKLWNSFNDSYSGIGIGYQRFGLIDDRQVFDLPGSTVNLFISLHSRVNDSFFVTGAQVGYAFKLSSSEVIENGEVHEFNYNGFEALVYAGVEFNITDDYALGANLQLAYRSVVGGVYSDDFLIGLGYGLFLHRKIW